MASRENAITLQIQLKGGRQFQRDLHAAGKAGEDAAKRIEGAGTGSNVFAGLAAGLARMRESFGQLGEHAVSVFDELQRGQKGEVFATLASSMRGVAEGGGALALAGAAVGTAVLKMGDEAARATREIQNQAASLGLDTEKFESLQLAAEVAGVAHERFVPLMERFSAAVGRAKAENDQLAQSQRQAAEEAEDARRRLGISMQEGAAATEKFALSQEEFRLGLESSDRAAGSLERNIARLSDQYNALPALDPDKMSPAAYSRASQQAEQLQAQISDLEDQRDEQEKRNELARQRQAQAEQDQRIAMERRAQEEDQLRRKAEDTAIKTANAEERTKNAAAAMLFAAGAGSKDVTETLGRFADQLNAITDDQERAAAAAATLGRGWAELDPLLRTGSKGIRDLMEANKEFTVQIKPDETGMAQRFNAAMARFRSIAEGLRRLIGNIFGQLWTPVLNDLANFLKDNKEAVRAWATSAEAVIRDFGATAARLLLPSFQLVGQTIRDLFRLVGLLAQGFSALFGGHLSAGALVAIALFTTLLARVNPLLATLTALGEIINGIFGTNLNTGGIVALALAFTSLYAIVGRLRIAMLALADNAMVLAAFGAVRLAVVGLSQAIIAAGAAITTGLAAAGPGGWLILGLGFLALGITNVVLHWAEFRQSLSEFGAWLRDTFAPIWTALGNNITAITGLLSPLAPIWNAIWSVMRGVVDWLRSTFGPVWHSVVEPIIALVGRLIAQIERAAAALKGLFGGAESAGAAGGATDATGGAAAGAAGGGGGDDSGGGGSGDFTSAVAAYNARASTPTAPSSAPTGFTPLLGEDTGSPMAGGGAVHGPGTSTSDSIPAMLSAGEFVVNAKSVAHYGAGFMHAINSRAAPLRAAWGGLVAGFQDLRRVSFPDLARGFARGGLVGGLDGIMPPAMGFAGGGMVQAFAGSAGSGEPMSHVTVVLDGKSHGPMLAPRHIADGLVSEARHQDLTKTGRKPSWSR